MGPGLDIISEIPNIKVAANATSLQALIRRLKETNLTDIDMVTGEQQYHSSMTIYSKEFTVFLGYHNHELMSTLCDWYDCDRRWSYETIARKKEEIVGVWVNLIAGTTPDLIQSSLPIESIGGGLTSRIIFVFEEKRDKIVPLPTQTAAEKDLFSHLVSDLEKISMMSGTYRWTEDFSNKWTDFCYECENKPPFYDSRFDGYMGRRRNHIMKLTMIMSASKGDHGLVLTGEDFDDAYKILTETEVKMPLVFRGVGKSDISSILHRVIAYLKTSPVNEIPIWRLARAFKDDLDDFTLRRVLTTIESMKLVKVITRPGGEQTIQLIDESECV
jgi:hypothetical protein